MRRVRHSCVSHRLAVTVRRLLLIVGVLIACVALDQATKAVAQHSLVAGETITMLDDSIRLGIAHNYGTFLSLGASLPENVRNVATTVGVGIILAGLFGYALLAKESNPVVTIAIAMLIGGGVSNLIDRIVYGGYVIDFLNVGIGPLRTGIFNVADMFIMAGVVLLLFAEQIRRRFVRRTSTDSAR